MRKILAGGICVISLVLASACGGTPSLSSACKSAVTREQGVVGSNNRAIAALNSQGYNTTSSMLPHIWQQDQAAIKAAAAVCPSSVQVLDPA